MQPLARETVTIRHSLNETAVPYRQYGSFLLGDGVGGAGVHWNGQHYRAVAGRPGTPAAISNKRYGKKFMPADMTIQDYRVTSDELEPFFDHFEYLCGTSGKAGNLNGEINGQAAIRSKGRAATSIPIAARADNVPSSCSRRPRAKWATTRSRRLRRMPRRPYTNPYGVQLGPCNFCGYCELFGCYMYSKASPQT